MANKNRWITEMSQSAEVPEIDAFIAEIDAVCKKHGLSIAHEDGHGAFIVEAYDDFNLSWLSDAHDGRALGRRKK